MAVDVMTADFVTSIRVMMMAVVLLMYDELLIDVGWVLVPTLLSND